MSDAQHWAPKINTCSYDPCSPSNKHAINLLARFLLLSSHCPFLVVLFVHVCYTQSSVFYGGSALLSGVNAITPHLAGAVDIMVVEQPDKSYKSSPFYGTMWNAFASCNSKTWCKADAGR